MSRFTLEVSYGGKFVRGVTVEYVCGQQDSFTELDPDLMSFIGIGEMLGLIGITTWKSLQYCEPGLELHEGLRSLGNDEEVLKMTSSLNDGKYIKLYVESDNQDDDEVDVEGAGVSVESDDSIGIDLDYEIEVASLSASGDDSLRSVNESESEWSEDWLEFTSASTDIQLGMTFGSLGDVKDLVVDYAITNGYNVRFVKNEKNVRLTAICAEGCKWKMHASKMYNEDAYQIKTYNNVHSCARVMENRHATAEWVVKKYLDRFRSHATWQIPSIIETVRQDYNVNITPTMVYRARCMARRLNDGSAIEQYKLLWSYAEEIRRTNPGSSFFVGLDRVTEDSPVVFQRAYMCFNACKQGMIMAGRPMTCLDGCHLKGPCPGHLLTAVGIDGNDGIYPIAVAIVESECNASWKWFLDIVAMDLRIGDGGFGWTFMSDQQKGIVDYLAKDYDHVEIRYCVRHLYANFKLKFRGKIYNDAMMSASNATTQYEFDKEMKKLSFVDRAAYTYLTKINPEY